MSTYVRILSEPLMYVFRIFLHLRTRKTKMVHFTNFHYSFCYSTFLTAFYETYLGIKSYKECSVHGRSVHIRV
jgi:hypothetical protein